MSKFNPETVPSWVRWIAVDADGWCWGYSSEPKKKESARCWAPKSPSPKFRALYIGSPPKNWKEELYTWGYDGKA